MLSIGKSKTITPNREVGYQLHKLTSALARRADQLLTDELDLSLSQFMILMGTNRSTRLSQCKVARFLNVTEAAVSRQIDSLVETGWIIRKPNPENRREHILELTPSGSDILTKAETVLDGMYKEAFSRLTHDEQSKLRHILGKLQASIGPVVKEGEK